jgi:hypothetical protein
MATAAFRVPTLTPRHQAAVPEICGQACGQQVIGGPKPAPFGPPAYGAQKSSSRKSMPIKHLHVNDGFVTLQVRAPGSAPRPVEFLAGGAVGV